MKRSHVTLVAAAAAGVAAAGIAFASGGPAPVQPTDPAADTVVATASWQARVVAPARRTDATIDRAMRVARIRAMPAALEVARDEANALAKAAGLGTGRIVGIRRDIAPPGCWDQETGRFGPGRWCGRVYTHRRVGRADGTTKRVTRSRHGCPVPKRATIRITVTYAASPR